MDVFDLVAKISLDPSSYEQGLDNAGNKTTSFSDKLKSGLATAAKAGAAALAAVTAATTALATAMVKGVSDTAAYGDNIDKMSQKMGLSAQAYQEWDAIMQHSGTSIESLQSGMKTLANAVENGNGAFERLGISQEQIASMDNEQLFSATITALQNVDNETERTYLAGQLLGRGATELGALLNTSAEDTEKMRQRVHELGGVMSDDAVKSAAAYQDSLQDMKTAFSGLSRGLTAEFLPSFTTVMDGITEFFAGDSQKGIGMVSQGIDRILETINNAIPQMMERGQQLLTGLVNGISEYLPKIADTGIQIIVMLSTSLISAVPQIASAAVEIITTLANGLADQLPTLVPIAVNAILQLAQALTNPDSLSNLVNAAINLVQSLADGILNSLPLLMEQAPVIIANLMQAISENAPKLLESGLQIIMSLVDGILSNLPQIVTTSVQIVASLVDTIWNIDWIQLGTDILQFIIDGIVSLFGALLDTAFSLVDLLFSSISDVNWYQLGADVLNFIIKGISSLLGSLLSLAVRLVSTVWDKIANTDWLSLGRKVLEFIINGIKNLIPNLLSAAQSVVKTVWDLITNTNWLSLGSDLLKKFINGIRNMFSGLGSAAKDTVSKIWDTITHTDWLSLGQNIISGIANGVGNAAHMLIDAARNVASRALNAIKEFFGIASPSKVMAKEIGRWLPPGIGIGMEQAMPQLISDVKNQMQWVVDTANFALSDMAADSLGLTNIPSISTGYVSKSEASAYGNGYQLGNSAGGRVVVNQTIYAAEQSPIELAANTRAAFQRARWAIA